MNCIISLRISSELGTWEQCHSQWQELREQKLQSYKQSASCLNSLIMLLVTHQRLCNNWNKFLLSIHGRSWYSDRGRRLWPRITVFVTIRIMQNGPKNAKTTSTFTITFIYIHPLTYISFTITILLIQYTFQVSCIYITQNHKFVCTCLQMYASIKTILNNVLYLFIYFTHLLQQ